MVLILWESQTLPQSGAESYGVSNSMTARILGRDNDNELTTRQE